MKKIVVLLVCFWQPTWAQIRPMHEIEQLLDAEKNDSALLALQPHLAVNKNSYTYFRALLNEGIALFQSGQTTKAIGRFHEVQNALVRKPFPDLLARADLKLASIHESAHAGEHCKHYLLRAEEQIEKFSLDSLRPELYIRKSSYFRVFEEKSQMQPYLEKVFELASKYRKYKEMAEAHLLSEVQYDVTEADAKIRHLDQGIHYYALAGNSPGTSAMYFLKGRLYRKIHQPDKAMAMVDSSIYYARKVPEVQHSLWFESRIAGGTGSAKVGNSVLARFLQLPLCCDQPQCRKQSGGSRGPAPIGQAAIRI
jgi:tetratricopeptide (TPR) repeat protein